MVMKLICDICGEQYYTQVDPHEMGEPRICSDACAWEVSNNGETKPEKIVEEIIIGRVVDNKIYIHSELYETNVEHGHFQSVIFTATPLKRCVVRIRIEKLRDLEEGE